MNMKKMKKFFTLSRRAEGFTLVELIVVIAILAILGGVALPAYSGYIKKAHMAADQTLVSDVMKALQLQYYNNPNGAVATYVVLTPGGSGTVGTEFDAEGNPKTAYVTVGGVTLADDPTFGDTAASADFADKAMTAVFGADWKNTVVLAYDEWAKANYLPTKEAADKVAKSTFYQNSNPANVTECFSGVADSLNAVVMGAGSDPMKALEGYLSPTQLNDMKTALGDLSWEKDKDAYSTAVSNLLVKEVASEVSGYKGGEDEELSGMGEIAVAYAQIYAWASVDPEGAKVFAEMHNKVTTPGVKSEAVSDAVEEAMAKASAEDSSFQDYYGKNGTNDIAALSCVMGTVKDWANNADMTTAGLYSSESITDAVNNYFAAVEIVASGNLEGFEDVLTNSKGVVVYISSTGKVGCNIELK